MSNITPEEKKRVTDTIIDLAIPALPSGPRGSPATKNPVVASGYKAYPTNKNVPLVLKNSTEKRIKSSLPGYEGEVLEKN